MEETKEKEEKKNDLCVVIWMLNIEKKILTIILVYALSKAKPNY